MTAPAQAWLEHRLPGASVRIPLRIARCGTCGSDPRHPIARACTTAGCPLRHDAASAHADVGVA